MKCVCVLLLLLQCLPIVNGSTRVSAGLDINHQNGATQEPHTHAKADAVHCLVSHKHFTVDISLQAGDREASSVFTEAWDLQQITGRHFLILQSIFVQDHMTSHFYIQIQSNNKK